jgi:ribosomal protein S6--L-glutamate ligase
MRIAILSRGKSLHSIRRLLAEARKAGVPCDVIDPLECQLVVDGRESRILLGNQELPHYDAVLPRIGASITDFGLAVVRQFEALGMRVVNSSDAIQQSRDKMRSLQALSRAGLDVPPSVLTRSERGTRSAIAAVRGMPVVMKVLQGTQGVGVMIVHSQLSMVSVMDAMRSLGQDLILQQFIAEGAGRDFRAFVIGNRVVAAMVRTAPSGEFRSNIHRGGEGAPVRLSAAYERVAVRAARELGLQVAGVDLMESRGGPLVIEVNSSPGFEGIEKATKLNIAGMIVRHLAATARKSRKPRSKKTSRARRRTVRKRT